MYVRLFMLIVSVYNISRLCFYILTQPLGLTTVCLHAYLWCACSLSLSLRPSCLWWPPQWQTDTNPATLTAPVYVYSLLLHLYMLVDSKGPMASVCTLYQLVWSHVTVVWRGWNTTLCMLGNNTLWKYSGRQEPNFLVVASTDIGLIC
jgi:hypothetical protein